MSISVVLIVRNQEWNVRRLVESVLDELQREGLQSDVVLVDSASTDGGPAVAATYPIEVLVLEAEEPLTAAAGRHVGYTNTTGDYVLFLDGDMELVPGWLTQAADVLDQNSEIAAVTGHRIDVIPGESALPQLEELRASEPGDQLRTVPHGGGAALYRRAYLDETGSFNPFLVSDEEPELCIRLRYGGGYRIVALSSPHVIHYSQPLEEFSTLLGRARRGLYVGSGQCIRYLWGSSLIWPYLRERGFGLMPGLVLLLGLVSVGLAVFSGVTWPLLLWFAAVVGVIALDAARKRSIREALLMVLRRSLHFVGTIRGLFAPAPPPESYQGNVTVLR